MFTKSPELR